MSRGNNKQHLFIKEEEKSYFRYLLLKNGRLNGVHILHYCLMNNHIHLIVRLEHNANLSRFMKQVFLAYYSLFKNSYGYVGHLYQGRYKSIIIETEAYLIHCGKYIELNPVRAGIVSEPGDYEFSSYRFYAYGVDDPLVSPNPVYFELGDNPIVRQKAYQRLFVNERLVNSNKLRSQLYLGSQEFIERMESLFGVQNVSLKRGRPKSSL